MGDRSWLGFVGRSRTPQPIQQQAPTADNPDNDDDSSTVRAGESGAQRSLQRSLTQIPLQKPPHKAARLSRISSYMGLGTVAKTQSPATPTFPTTPGYYETKMSLQSESTKSRTVSYQEAVHDPSTGIWRKHTMETEYRFRESDCTWHNPNLRQMMETVSCTIMTNGVSEPIPRHLNGFIASMIEEFSIHYSKTKKLQRRFAELEDTREKEVQEFAAMADEWTRREKNFKAEIKRLECIIADTQKGAESVVLARADSVCNRNDGRAFRAKLNRLSRSMEDEDLDYGENRQCLVQGGMREAFALPTTTDTGSNQMLSSIPPNQTTGGFLSEHINETSIGPVLADNSSRDDQTAAVHRFVDKTVPKNLGRGSNSTTASSSNGIASSTSSALLIGQGILADTTPREHITPHTTPPHTQPPNKTIGLNAVEAVRELVQLNGGLPEDAIDDGSSYAPSFAPPPHIQKFTFDAGGDGARDDRHLHGGPGTTHGNADNLPQWSQLSTVYLEAPGSQLDGVHYGSHSSPNGGRGRQDSNESDNTSSSSSSRSSRSSILLSMGHNHVGRATSNTTNDHKVYKGSSLEKVSQRLMTTSPTRKAESGQVPFPSRETVRIARLQRTTSNDSTNGRAFFSSEELNITNKEVLALQRARVASNRMRHDVTTQWLGQEAQYNRDATLTATKDPNTKNTSRKSHKARMA